MTNLTSSDTSDNVLHDMMVLTCHEHDLKLFETLNVIKLI
jgi:hypothetical protein